MGFLLGQISDSTCMLEEEASMHGKTVFYFCTTSGNVTDDVILQYIEQHGGKPTGVSR